MRDLLNDLSEGLSHPDPIRRAQIQMKKALPKKFYSAVTVAGSMEEEFRIELDGKPIRTPARQLLKVPSSLLADLIAFEWREQGEEIDPSSMPVTRLVNTAIDGVANDRQAVLEDIIRFSTSDLLCYRADGPEALVERQRERWDPVLDWAASEFGARFILIEGVIHHNQPAEAISAFASRLARYDDAFQLAALHTMTTLTGSALLALAFAGGFISMQDVWNLAHLDEDWTIEQWGSDEEAEKRRAWRFAEFKAAADVFQTISR
ncbi:ATP12 family chaperone protein [Oryzifoliimicrobium ureilyticus]|uniref:ATP12 family chaperone protein n=1 Tax=Oryzifoliimicrobium ureilyticus TaxID=3113724 RepID=UPI0030763D09